MPYTRLFYHFIWSTKDRLPLITDENRTAIYSAIRAKVTALGGITHALNGMDDQIHLVVTVPPKIALADFIGLVKGNSSHLVTKLSDQPFKWQNEYGLLSVSESHLPSVVKYVVEQQKHHSENMLDERLEGLEDEGGKK